MFVLTLDQRHSQRGADDVEALLGLFGSSHDGIARPFERTAGDEVQGLLTHAGTAVDLVSAAVRRGNWWIGIGVGDVETPLPDTVRAARGAAFVCARAAVDKAKTVPTGLAVFAHPDLAAEATRAQSALRAWVRILQRRTDEGWEAVDLMAGRSTQREAADALGVTAQSLNARLRRAGWHEDRDLRDLCAWLLAGCDVSA